MFSSNPQLSRPDILTLRDDRGMISEDHIVPVVRRSLLRRYGRPLRRRLDTASRLLSTLELRGLNQQVIDGRIPEAVGGEFADSNGLGGPSARRQGSADPRRLPGLRRERDARAPLRRGAARRRLPRARSAGRRAAAGRGRAPCAITGSTCGPATAARCSATSAARTCKRALKPIGATALRFAPAQDRNGFAMKRDTARALGISKLSDLTRYWPAAAASTSRAVARAAGRPAPERAVGGRAGQRARPARRLGSSAAAPGVTVAIVDTGAQAGARRPRPQRLDQLRRDPRQRRRRRPQRLRRRRPRRRPHLHARPARTSTTGTGTARTSPGSSPRPRTGAAWSASPRRRKLMIVKVLDDKGAGTTGAVAEGIRYAAANGARIINCSLGGDQDDPRMTAAVTAAGAANALVVASAGNDGRDIDAQPQLPGRDPRPEPGRGRRHRPRVGPRHLELLQLRPPHGAGRRARRRDPLDSATTAAGSSSPAPRWPPRWSAGVARPGRQREPAHLRGRSARRADAERDPLPAAGRGRVRRRAALGARRQPRRRVRHDAAAPAAGSSPPPARASARKVQAAVLGSTAAIRRYRDHAGRQDRSSSAARPSSFTVNLRAPRRAREGRRGGCERTGARPRAQRKVTKLRKGKRGVGTGGGVGT